MEIIYQISKYGKKPKAKKNLEDIRDLNCESEKMMLKMTTFHLYTNSEDLFYDVT